MRCIGGQMQGRLQLDTDEKIARAGKMGISDPSKIYRIEEMAKGDVLFAATGVTDGNLLAGVKFNRNSSRPTPSSCALHRKLFVRSRRVIRISKNSDPSGFALR